MANEHVGGITISGLVRAALATFTIPLWKNASVLDAEDSQSQE